MFSVRLEDSYIHRFEPEVQPDETIDQHTYKILITIARRINMDFNGSHGLSSRCNEGCGLEKTLRGWTAEARRD